MTDFFEEDIFGYETIRRREIETKAQLVNLHRSLLDRLISTGESCTAKLSELEDRELLYDELYAGRQLELEMSSLIEERNESIAEYSVPDNDSEGSFPVKVSMKNDRYLVIDTPLIFRNSERYTGMNQLSLLAREVECAARIFEKESGLTLARKIQTPYWMVMVRKIRKGYAGNMADSDNIEAKKISNVISRILFLSDAPTVKRDLTLCEEAHTKNEVGTSFIIAEEKNILPLLERYIRSGNMDL